MSTLDKIQKLKGFREFYPEVMAARRKVFDTMHRVARSFGFHEIDTPSLEPLELFRIKSGEEIVQQTFSFVDKGGREVTLIPELTPSVARMVANRKDLPRPVKWYSIGKMWRYEEPQSGRLREFYQFNADIFGSPKPEADAEVIALAMKILDSLDLGGKYIMRVSDRILMEEILRGIGVEGDLWEVLRVIDKKEKVDEEKFREMLSGVGLVDKQIDDLLSILDVRGRCDELSDVLGKYPQYQRLSRIFELVEAYNVKGEIILDLSIVRGLAYYSSTVFEAHDAKRELRAILGGGRYDGVVELFGGEHTPAVGFAIGDAVLEILMKREGVWPEEKISVDYYIAVIGDSARKTGIKIANSLREKGFRVDLDVMGRSLSKQMKYAARINARKVIIVGEDEVKKGAVIIRDMASGEQEEKRIKEIVES